MLETIKALIGISDASKDSIIKYLIDRCTEEAKNYTHNNVDALKNTIISMVIYQYNRLGSEGLTSEDYAGVSFDYSESYPDSILNSLKGLRKVRVIA